MNSTHGTPGVGEDLAVGVVERAPRVVTGPHLAGQRQERGDLRDRRPVRAAAAARQPGPVRAAGSSTGTDSFQVSLARCAW